MKLEDMFDMVTWTLTEEKFFVDLLIDYSNDGKLFGDGCQNDVLQETVVKLTQMCGRSFSHMKVVKKFKSLKDRYKLWEIVTFWHGVRFNVAENKCEASDETWDAILKEHPSAKKYKKEGEKLWCELSLIFGGQISERTKTNIEIICKFSEKLDAIVIYDSENDDIGGVVHDEVYIVGISDHKLKPAPPASHCGVDGKGKTVANNAFVKMKMTRFEGDYSCATSGVSSTASSFWPQD